MIKYYQIEELINHAANKSPYYKELYKNLDLVKTNLSDLPIINQDDFWRANTFKDNKLLTGNLSDGIVFKSGGTTGSPKFSIFSKSEWESFTAIFGRGLDTAGFDEGDRVANLFYAGDLYASFVFIMKSLEYAKTPLVHFPVTGQTSQVELIKMIKEYEINTLVGVPTSFVNLASLVGEDMLPVTKIFYGGESLFPDQRDIIQNAFPKAKISSVGYASVDGGHLGYIDSTCARNEHKVFLPESIVEIVDPETNSVITEIGKPGKLIYTNLTRKLMPILRYPVGDMASWVEVGTKFLLQGRTDEGARIGPVTVNRDDVVDILSKCSFKDKVGNFQLIISRELDKDKLTICLGLNCESDSELILKEELESVFYQERPMFQEAISQRLINFIEVEVRPLESLVKNPRTGKLRLVIDQRNFS